MKVPSYTSYQMSKYRSVQDFSNALTAHAEDTMFAPRIPLYKPLNVRRHMPKVMKGNIRDQLRQMGLNESVITIAIPMTPMLPRSSDADQQGVQAIIKGIQRWFGLPPTGFLDARTGSYLRKVGGATWMDMNWASLISHVLAAPPESVKNPILAISGLGLDEGKEIPTWAKYALIAGTLYVGFKIAGGM